MLLLSFVHLLGTPGDKALALKLALAGHLELLYSPESPDWEVKPAAKEGSSHHVCLLQLSRRRCSMLPLPSGQEGEELLLRWLNRLALCAAKDPLVAKEVALKVWTFL